ncbi:MAG: Lrp/AsnC family transcriptional regulator [Candidatus Thorarchaeota archaeon]|nr:Lrp/AsnC family transcriptional regulator [Candidatus Thorarchaeota archaeon]
MLQIKLDDTDLKILEILQKDSKRSIASIAKEVGKGISTVHDRIKTLQNDGIIKGFTAIVSPQTVGRETLAFILVTIRYRVPGQKTVLSQREFCQEIAVHPFVQSVHVLSGEYDVLLKVRTKNIEEMNHFIVDFLRELPAVDKTLTMFAMDSYLDSLVLRDLSL